MLLYSPERKRLTRTGNVTAAAAGLGLLLTATACGNGGEGLKDEGSSAVSASAPGNAGTTEAPTQGDTVNPSAAKIGKATLNKLVWPGTVELTDACPVWSKEHHGPLTVAKDKNGKPQLLVMADARLSSPRNCSPEADDGAGMQNGASSRSGAAELPALPELYNGSYVNDGVVLKINRYTTAGEESCLSDGTNETTVWIEAQAREGDPLGWMPISNAGFPGVSDMKKAGIPEATEQAVYAGTGQGDCPGF